MRPPKPQPRDDKEDFPSTKRHTRLLSEMVQTRRGEGRLISVRGARFLRGPGQKGGFKNERDLQIIWCEDNARILLRLVDLAAQTSEQPLSQLFMCLSDLGEKRASAH